MAKGVFLGINGLAKKIKKPYIGVNNVVKKVKKIYVGVAGAIKLAWSGEIEFKGAITPLSFIRGSITGSSNDDYALFAGGYTGAEAVDIVDAYSNTLARTTAPPLSKPKSSMCGVKTKYYAFFAGGRSGRNAAIPESGVEVYSRSLFKMTTPNLTSAKMSPNGGATSDYVIISNGHNGEPNVGNKTTDAYNTSLVKTPLTDLSTGRGHSASVSVGNSVLFGGGWSVGVNTGEVESYDNNLTKSSLAYLSVARRGLIGASVGKYGLFCGGITGGMSGAMTSDVVDIYDSSLVRLTPTSLLRPKEIGLQASASDNCLLFGGNIGGYKYTDEVEVYDSSLVRTSITPFTNIKSVAHVASAIVGDNVLVAGGSVSSGYSDTVEYYEM